MCISSNLPSHWASVVNMTAFGYLFPLHSSVLNVCHEPSTSEKKHLSGQENHRFFSSSPAALSACASCHLQRGSYSLKWVAAVAEAQLPFRCHAACVASQCAIWKAVPTSVCKLAPKLLHFPNHRHLSEGGSGDLGGFLLGKHQQHLTFDIHVDLPCFADKMTTM